MGRLGIACRLVARRQSRHGGRGILCDHYFPPSVGRRRAINLSPCKFSCGPDGRDGQGSADPKALQVTNLLARIRLDCRSHLLEYHHILVSAGPPPHRVRFHQHEVDDRSTGLSASVPSCTATCDRSGLSLQPGSAFQFLVFRIARHCESWCDEPDRVRGGIGRTTIIRKRDRQSGEPRSNDDPGCVVPVDGETPPCICLAVR